MGEGKMSKTVEGSSIFLTDGLEDIKRKIAAVPTDSGTSGGDVPKSGGVAALFSFLKLFNHTEAYTKYEQDYRAGTIRYSEMKADVSQAIFEVLEPIQEKRKEIESTFNLERMINDHTNICREVASQTLLETKQKMGLV